MKTLALFLLTGYQTIVSPLLHQVLGQQIMCRYEKSCSAYAKDVISQYGVVKGSGLALRRLMSCSSFSKPYANI